MILIVLFILLIILIIVLFFSRDNFTNLNLAQTFEIFIINLDRGKDRLEHIDKIMKKAGLNYTRIPGIDGKKFKTVTDITASEGYGDLYCLGGQDRTGHLPHTGCYLSHLKCLKQASEGNSDKVLILEDDASFIVDNFAEVLTKIVQDNTEVDFIWLNADNDKTVQEKKEIPTWGLHGYIVSKKGAKILYDMLMPDSEWIKDTEDCLADWVMPVAVKDSKLKWKHFSLIGQRDGLVSSIDNDGNGESSSSDDNNYAAVNNNELIIKKPTSVPKNSFYRRKKYFIHIPKTGGTSIVNSMPYINSVVHRKLGARDNYQDNDYVFTIIRDPYDRFQSAFWHHQTLDSTDHYWRHLDHSRSKIRKYFADPNDFIKALTDVNNPKHTNAMEDFNQFDHFVPQTFYVSDTSGNLDPRISKIYIYSKDLSEKLGVPIKTINKTPKHPDVKLNEASKKFIKNYYAKDFELMEYVRQNGE